MTLCQGRKDTTFIKIMGFMLLSFLETLH